jgi:pilus assembly protein CpaF
MTNTILIIITVICSIIVLYVIYRKAKSETVDFNEKNAYTMDSLLETVRNNLTELVKEDNFGIYTTDSEFENLYKRRARIQDAMTNSVYGIDSAKTIVQDLIRNVIEERLDSEEEVLKVIDFNSRSLDVRVKFEILLYFFKKYYGRDALTALIEKYDLDKERYEIEERLEPSYVIREEDINDIYMKEGFELDYEIMIDIISILIFQRYKGFGIVDTIREMNINGFNCGTSGSILSSLNAGDDEKPKASKSVWLYYKGKYIHMKFLNFNTEEELRRVIQLICRYNNPGPLTEKRGYLVNTMYDKSRVLALRPPVSEYWAVFIRKFTLSDQTTEGLIDKPYTKNAYLAVQLLMYLMLCEVTCGITGRQGSGKTTLMSALVKYIDPRYTIRVLEIAPELYLRELYPERNILSVQETDYVSATILQDALKKSDAAVSIVGEVASDSIAARMIQLGQVASLFTIFSHHGKTPKDLVYALRNSLVNAGGFTNMLTAEQQVIDVVKIDIHLDYTPDGKRYIERISEIIRLDDAIPYPDYDEKDPINTMNSITKEYYVRRTDRQTFIIKDILCYDVKTHTYYTKNWISSNLTEYMMNNISDQKRSEFEQFIADNWKGGASA